MSGEKVYFITVESVDNTGEPCSAWTLVGENFVNSSVLMAEDMPYIIYDMCEQISWYQTDKSKWAWSCKAMDLSEVEAQWIS